MFFFLLKVFQRSGIIFYIIRPHNNNNNNNDEQQIDCRTTSIEKVEEKQTEINTTWRTSQVWWFYNIMQVSALLGTLSSRVVHQLWRGGMIFINNINSEKLSS